MKINVGGWDRKLRVGAGLLLTALAATGQIGHWGYVGVVLVATGAIGFCPAYLPFGISSSKTCKS